ncbi:hypothetical protein [Desulfofundulus kuznetsovii]
MFESNKYDEEVSPGFSPAQGIVKGISSFSAIEITLSSRKV